MKPQAVESFGSSDTRTGVEAQGVVTPGTLLAGRYRVHRRLGCGGMGVVYRARDQELGVDVALKIMRSELGADPEWGARFRRELLLARQVTHKNVVRIHDIGEDGGLLFLTMRLVEGRSLLDVMEKDGPLPLERALHVFRQVAEAVEQAHEAGVVHRDLKPANVLLSPDDTAYVTDFGVACSLAGDRLTRSGVIVGTLEYLSPEQLAGDPVDGRSDVYALGILLFEMLTGELPFRAPSRAEALARRLAGKPHDLAEAGVRAPAYVRRVLRRCLDPRASRRYPTVRALLDDLDGRRAGLRDHLRHPLTPAIALGLLLLPGAAALYRQGFEAEPPGGGAARVPAPVSLAVLPLADQTGDASLAWTPEGVAEILAARLAESPRLRVLDAARVFRTVRDLHLSGGIRDENTLTRVAELLGVDRVVTGSLRRAGRTLRLELRLVDPGESGTPPELVSAETSEPGGLFHLVRSLGEQLRAALGGEPPAGPAPEPGTASLEAARAHREGRERLLLGDFLGAAPAFERAVAADPGFADAQEGLSEAFQALGYHDKAVAAARRAEELVGSSDTRLAWRVRARLALLGGDPAAAERAYAELVRRYPNDTEALLDLAVAQTDQGAVDRALSTLEDVVELDAGDPRVWLLMGKNRILAGDSRKAVTDPLVRALALMTQLGNEQGEGDVLNAMGVAHQRLGEYAKAAERYGEAAAIRRRVGDRRGTAVSLRNRASIRLFEGRHDEAEPDLRAARAIYQSLGDRKGLAEVWNGFGALHEGRGDYAEARSAYQEALRVLKELGDEQQIAQSSDNLGYAFFVEGDHDNALHYWERALDLRRKNGDRAGVVLSTQNMGFLQTAQGRWREAMRSFLQALELSREIDFTNAMAVSHGNIGLLHQYEGRYAAALDAYSAALELLRRLGDRRGLAEFTLKEAQVLLGLGRLREARTKLEDAAGWVRETGNREQASDLQALLADCHLRGGAAREAREALATAVELAEASRSRTAILRARIARGSALVSWGQAAEAVSDLQAASRQADRLGDVLLKMRAAEALARARLAGGRPREAEGLARQAIRSAEQCGWEDGLHRLHALLADVLEARGDPRAAHHRGESARRLGRLRQALPPELRAPLDVVPPAPAAPLPEVESAPGAHS